MLCTLGEILEWAKNKRCAVPAFNVYNAETVIGVAEAAKEMKAPIIIQIYSRLFDEINGSYAMACAKEAAHSLRTPVAIHLDHGAGMKEVVRALSLGASSIMIDASSQPLDENIAITRSVVNMCKDLSLEVEGELGHIGMTSEGISDQLTDPDEALRFVSETSVSALAVLIGNAHGRYKLPPKLNIERTRKIAEAVKIPLVLHGGTGIPDDQILAAVDVGVKKVNFGTDICYAFLDALKCVPDSLYALDLVMKEPIESVKRYAISKIKLLERL